MKKFKEKINHKFFVDKLKNFEPREAKRKVMHFINNQYKICVKNYPLVICFILSSLINAILLRVLTVGNLLDLGPILMDLGVVTILASPTFLFKYSVSMLCFLTNSSNMELDSL